MAEVRHYMKLGGFSLHKGSNGTFEGGVTEQETVCPNKYILKSFIFLANNLDICLIWTYCISIFIINVDM